MLLKPFRIHTPSSPEEAAGLAADLGEAATFYAGGTELLLAMKQGLLHYEHLIDIKGIAELHGITWDGERQVVRIGAAVTHSQLEESQLIRERLPLLGQLERQVANVRVRSSGTIGGNLCFADPHSDPGTLFLALGASIQLAGTGGRRWVAAEDFFLDAYETVRQPDELMVAVEIPWPGPEMRGAYQRFAHLERPAVGVTALLWQDSSGAVNRARVAVGCVSPRAIRVAAAEELLAGKRVADIGDEVAAAAAEAAAAAVDPVADLGGSVEYKRHLTGVLARRAIMQAAAQFNTAEE